MHCPQCQFANRDDATFCEECGAKLEQTCPACRSAVPLGRKFCGQCGQSLTAAAPPALKYASPQAYTPKHLAEKILTSKSAMEGERKAVTVVFADVSGFTAMSERLDPEEVHEIMDRAFAVILDAVHRFEGTINQFLGDGVMALFGAPIANEDHAHRALSAALAIQEGLRPLREDVRRCSVTGDNGLAVTLYQLHPGALGSVSRALACSDDLVAARLALATLRAGERVCRGDMRCAIRLYASGRNNDTRAAREIESLWRSRLRPPARLALAPRRRR